jgi:hypothetical protein
MQSVALGLSALVSFVSHDYYFAVVIFIFIPYRYDIYVHIFIKLIDGC